MKYSTIFFDLDDTLYPATTGMWEAIGERINQFMIKYVGIQSDDVAALRDQLWRQYGTTLRGLQNLYHIDAEQYLAYVHDVPLADYITPDPQLPAALASLPQRKIIFTNADVNHARRVLSLLNIEDAFAGIFDVLSFAPYCKPYPQAFQNTLTRLGEQAERCVLVDDQPVNLRTAHELGFYTVLVGRSDPHNAFHASIPSITALPEVLTEGC